MVAWFKKGRGPSEEARGCLKNMKCRMFRTPLEFRADQSKYNDAAPGEVTPV